MDDRIGPFWMALVLNKAEQQITVAAFNLSKEKAEASARERESPDAPLLCVNVTGDPNTMAGQISVWLAENDIVGAENAETVRGIASGLQDMLKDMRKRNKKPGHRSKQ